MLDFGRCSICKKDHKYIQERNICSDCCYTFSVNSVKAEGKFSPNLNVNELKIVTNDENKIDIGTSFDSLISRSTYSITLNSIDNIENVASNLQERINKQINRDIQVSSPTVFNVSTIAKLPNLSKIPRIEKIETLLCDSDSYQVKTSNDEITVFDKRFNALMYVSEDWIKTPQSPGIDQAKKSTAKIYKYLLIQ